MNKNDDFLTKSLKNFDLEENEIEVYLFLLKNGAQTALLLSNKLNKTRSVIYRIIERLTSQSLVSEIINEVGRKFEANTPEVLKLKLAEQETEIKNLEDSMPEILEMLSTVTNENVSESSIKYYDDIEDLKQIMWNETKAMDKFRIYEIGKMTDFVGEDIHSKVIEEFARNKIQEYQLTNIPSCEEFSNDPEYVKHYWQIRYISAEDLKIDFETKIYNDVYCMYESRGKDIFCVEIRNEKLAEMQKDIFDFVWSFAKPMKVINERGKAILE